MGGERKEVVNKHKHEMVTLTGTILTAVQLSDTIIPEVVTAERSVRF